jgi:hypothetical protein
MLPAFFAAVTLSCACAAAPTGTDSDRPFRDPFTRPPAPNGGTPISKPPRVPRGPDGGDSTTPKNNSKPSTPATATDPATASIVADYVRWNIAIFNFLQAAWRPALVFVAGETSDVARDKAANAFLALSTTYLIAKQWKEAVPVVVFGVRGLQLVLLMTDIPDAGPGSDNVPDAHWSKARWQYLKKIEAQEKKERMQGVEKFNFHQLPENLRGPASDAPSGNQLTEEVRRRSMFSDQTLTKQQAVELLVKGAGAILGANAERFMRAYVWLYDRERIRQEGLSQAAIDLYAEGDALLDAYHLAKGPNVCEINGAITAAIPKWTCTVDGWGPKLDGVSPSLACYCPVTTPTGSWRWSGTARRNAPGFVCTVPGVGTCPMLVAAPLGTLCHCTGYGDRLGQVRR